MALPPELAETLAMVATALLPARKPWWIIGSAAVALHGATVTVADVDVLMAADDFRALMDRLALAPDPPPPSALFRSRSFARWRAPPMTVELMAGFQVQSGGVWREIAPVSREAIDIGNGTVFVPQPAELREILALSGRPKDLTRAALLTR